ncbi:MAG: alpha-amylase family glycosyl hydrolase, partial [Planctomycetota bacterium]
SKTVIYELHVRGFTRHEGTGTYRALAGKADYLRDLGVTAVELLPVHEFDETDVARPGLCNFWGYSPVAWLAPHRRYAAAAGAPDGPLLEFREMVLALHRAGIEVIVDVVFNHTAELDAAGPTLHLRGLDDEMYYLRDDAGDYADLSGCGNAVRAQHPTVRTLIRDALRWWVHGLGVSPATRTAS